MSPEMGLVCVHLCVRLCVDSGRMDISSALLLSTLFPLDSVAH